mgnify:CR=1 FL=1|tara:strand:+ start:674 stop:1183 length:510 start_codon:yes stop_codon:yes gene_type:complete
MRVAYIDHPPQSPTDLNPVSPEKRDQVSGPGLKAFLAITRAWGLTEKDQRILLGEPGRSTYFGWIKKAQNNQRLSLSLDTLLRISAVLGIHKALKILFVEEAEAMIWLKGPHHGQPFAGQAPLDVMLNGTQDDLMTVRRYLDAWRGGLDGGPSRENPIQPVRVEDIVWA